MIKRVCSSDGQRAAFTLDLRSLAVLRFGLGVLLIADLIFRSRLFEAMYTDAGVLPRKMLRDMTAKMDAECLWQWGTGTWSLHFWSGDPGPLAVLFVVAGVFAFLMAIGLWSRVATVASFLLLVSLHNRNPFILTSGDTYMRLVMFWCVFLPLGRIWSVDAWLARRRGRPQSESYKYFSAATAGLVFQVFILYFFTGLAKCNEIWWQGNAMFIVLNLKIYTTALGDSLRNWTWVHQFVSVATVASEVFLPPLLLIGWKNSWWRWTNLITFCLFHVAIVLSMSIGLFSFICCTIWIGLIPSGFWDRFLRSNVGSQPAESIGIADHNAAAAFRSPLRSAVEVFCTAMIPFMLLWNVFNIYPQWTCYEVKDPDQPKGQKTFRQYDNPLLSAYEIVGHALGIGQHFQMFGRPPNENPWFVYRARLEDGSEADIFEGGRKLTPGVPLDDLSAMPPFHWRKFHHDLVGLPILEIQRRLLEYEVEKWDKSHPKSQQVKTATLECYLDTVWPTPVLGELRGAIIWGRYPTGTSASPFDQLFNRVIGEGDNQGY